MKTFLPIALGAASWAIAHAWCHRRSIRLERGDRAAIAAIDSEQGGPDFGAALRRGIEIGSVSPAIAEEAHRSGLIDDNLLDLARSGAYARKYDRTVEADLPWLLVHLLATLAGATVSPAASVLMALSAVAAQTDTRFRVIPIPCAAAMLAAALVALPGDLSDIETRVVVLGLLVLLLLLGKRLADRMGIDFGTGDIVLCAAPLTATAGTAGVLVFPLALSVTLAVSALTTTWLRGSGHVSSVPLAAYTIFPTAASIIAGTIV